MATFSFHDVVPNERIVQTFSPDATPDLVVLERHTFEDLGDGRCRLTSQSMAESFEYHDVFLDAGLVEGWARLDDVLDDGAADQARRSSPMRHVLSKNGGSGL